MITIATAAAALSPPLNLRHATELRDRGYTVIPDAGISPSLVKDARAAVSTEFSRLLDNLEELLDRGRLREVLWQVPILHSGEEREKGRGRGHGAHR